MTRIVDVLTHIRAQVRRAIIAQSPVSGQQSSSEDATQDENLTQISSDFVEDINKQ